MHPTLDDWIRHEAIPFPLDTVAQSDHDRYTKALHHASVARQLLNFFAALARQKGGSPAGPLAVRDALMAENLASITRP
jgi:hypothetical protein